MRPMGDLVHVRIRAAGDDKTTKGGIILPGVWSGQHKGDGCGPDDYWIEYRERSIFADVISVGTGERDTNGVRVPIAVPVGAEVIIPLNADLLWTGQDPNGYLAHEADIIAWIEQTDKAKRVHPLGRWLLLRRDEKKTAHDSEILDLAIPEQYQQQTWTGTVIAHGPGDWAHRTHLTRYQSGGSVEVPTLDSRGRRYFQLRNGKPYRLDHDARTGARLRVPFAAPSLELWIGKVHHLFVPVEQVIVAEEAA